MFMFSVMSLYIIYVFNGVEGAWVQLLEDQGPAFVLFLFYANVSNAPAVSLVVPAFDDTGSLGDPPCWLVYPHGFHPG